MSSENIDIKKTNYGEREFTIIDACIKVAKELKNKDIHSAKVDFIKYCNYAKFDLSGLEPIFVLTCNDADSICEFITGFNTAPNRIRNLNGKGCSAFINEFCDS